jgi:folate-binding protein YgfZ
MNDDARGLIELRGEDSLKFLQGQVTCDLNALEPNHLLAGCHCTPKGRVIFLFSAQLLADDRLVLETHPSVVGVALASLKKYSVFFKTEVADISAQSGDFPSPLNNLQRLQAGIPDITEATTDLFIPQMLNLDALNFISFKKGCYTGQEVVARAHYLGTVKRRMYRLLLPQGYLPQPGEAIHNSDEKALGTVVNAQIAENQVEMLAVLSSSASDCDSMLINGQTLAVKFLPLPYQVD